MDYLDPHALMRIKSMELRAKVVVEGAMHGLHRSPYHGFSVEFSEYRQYAPGDDMRHMDWRVYARSDRHFIKKYEDETNLRCQFLVDQSRSMLFGRDKGLPKSEYAATLAATLGHFLLGQGDAVGVTTFDEDIIDMVPPRNRPGHFRRLLLLLEKEAEGTATEFGKPLERVATLQTRRGLFVLLSDLLAPIDLLRPRLGFLRARGHEVAVFQILDPRERTFDFDGARQFVDLETGRKMVVQPDQARGEYKRAMDAHQAAVSELCEGLGIAFQSVDTNRSLELALHDFLAGRAGQASSAASRVRNNRSVKRMD